MIMSEEQNYVEICDEDGVTTKCEIYDVVDFEDKTYALTKKNLIVFVITLNH